ncbi:MAG: nucleotidyltransferase [Bacteroidetes bacterium]|nr:nucleotidyltransferase [Bacteroidota bacterium]
MAPVAGKPFLAYVIDYFKKQQVEKFIFALGYKSEIIEKYIIDQKINFQISREEEPLGTGGAIKLACTFGTEKNILVLNGDTFFAVQLKKLNDFHQQQKADCTLALKPMKDFERYGSVLLKENQSVEKFEEKKFCVSGLINGGIYILDRNKFLTENLPEKFSFEKDYLEKFAGQRKIFGCAQDGYFIDIGIPEDYHRAQTELPLNI